MNKWRFVLATLLAGLMTVACDNTIYDGEGDCGTYYHIHFSYDMNMKFADAFSNEVTSMAFFVFDAAGKLTEQHIERDAAVLATAGYSIPLELEAGRYTLLAWAGLGNEESFDLLCNNAQVGSTRLEEMKVKLNRAASRANSVVDYAVSPLYHGILPLQVTSQAGTYHETMSLTKDTNTIRVVLQQLEGGEIAKDLFRYEITDNNGLMAHDNSLLADEMLSYEPWHISAGVAEVLPEEGAGTTSSVSVAVAEFTMARLMADHNPILSVYNTQTDEKVLSIPLVDYALLVKGNYNRSMSDQEYLDRQDEYNLTFFLDGGKWVSSVVVINSWRVVINDTGL